MSALGPMEDFQCHRPYPLFLAGKLLTRTLFYEI